MRRKAKVRWNESGDTCQSGSCRGLPPKRSRSGRGLNGKAFVRVSAELPTGVVEIEATILVPPPPLLDLFTILGR